MLTQEYLNNADMNEWNEQGYYEEKFHIPLVYGYWLYVGTWNYNGEYGVDLRRYNTNHENLMFKGFPLKEETWKKLYKIMHEFYIKKMFQEDVTENNKKEYIKKINIDDMYSIRTDTWEVPEKSGPKNTYLMLNLFKNESQQWWKNQNVMIRFELAGRFLNECQNNGLAERSQLTIKPVRDKAGKKYI